MIQSAKTITAEPKATKGAKAAEQGNKNLLSELDGSVEGQEFAAELAKEVSEVSVEEVKVMPIEISADQLLKQPSTLANDLPQSSQEATNPKVFDPALTKGVETLNDPSAKIKLTNEQVLQLANGETPALPILTAIPVMVEAKNTTDVKPLAMTSAPVLAQEVEAEAEITQAMLKTPQLNQVGRSPAIELTQAEIDPQLMNMEDFVVQKNNSNKKSMPTNGYGMKNETVKNLESGLKPTEVVSETQKAESASAKSVNSQQFILEMMKEQSQPKLTDVTHVGKVFNMSDIKTDQPNQIMNQITDYIVQAKAAKEPTVTMRVNHDELGMLDITVRKGQGLSQDVAISIGAHSAEGKNFFNANSKDLATHLSQAGISVSDIKVETSSQTAKNDFDMNNQSKQGSNSEKNFGSEQNQRKHDQDKRKELWNLLNKEAA